MIRAFSWVLGIMAVFSLLAWLVLVFVFPDEKVQNLLIDEVERRTGLRIEVGDLQLNILSGLMLRDVRLGPPSGFVHHPVKVDGIGIEYDLTDLLEGRLLIRRLRFFRPQLVIEMDGQGRSNLQVLAEGAKARRQAAKEDAGGDETQLAVELEDVQVVDLSLRLVGGPVQADLKGLELSLKGSVAGVQATTLLAGLNLPAPELPNLEIPGRASIRLAAKVKAQMQSWNKLWVQGELTAASRLGPAGRLAPGLTLRLAVSMDLSKQELIFEQVELDLDARPALRATGRMDQWDQGPVFDLQIAKLETQLKALEDWGLPPIPGMKFSGGVSLQDVSLVGRLGSRAWPQVQGRVHVDDLSLAYKKLQLVKAQGKLDLAFAPGAEGGGDLSAKGGLKAQSLGHSNFHLASPNLELDLSARMPVEGYQERGSRLRGRLDLRAARLRAGPLEGAQAKLNLRIRGETWSLDDSGLNVLGPSLKATWRLASWRVLREWRGPGMEGELDGGGEDWTLASRWALAKFQGKAALRLDSLRGPQAALRDGQVSARWRGSGLRPGLPFDRPLDLQVKLKAGVADVFPAGMHAEGLEIALGLPLRSLASRLWPLSFDFSARKGRLKLPQLESDLRAPGRVDLKGQVTLGFATRTLEIHQLRLDIEKILAMEAKGGLDLGGSTLDLSFSTDPHRLEAVRATLPDDLASRLPRMTGQVVLGGRLHGKLPRSWHWRSLVNGQSGFKAELKIRHSDCNVHWPERGLELEKLDGTVQLLIGTAAGRTESQLDLRLGRGRWAGAPLTVEDLSLALAATFDGEHLGSDGRLAIRRLTAEAHWPEALVDLELGGVVQLIGKKEFRLDELSLRSPAMGLDFGLSGQVVRPVAAKHWSEWRLAIRTHGSLSPPKSLRLPGQMRMQGGAGFEMAIKSQGAGIVRGLGKLTAKGLGIQGPGFSIQGAEGGIQVDQRLAIYPAPGLLVAKSSDASGSAGKRGGRSSAYDQALRPLKGDSRGFGISSIRLGRLEFSDMVGNLELGGGVLSLGSLRFAFLEGDVVADTSLILAPPGTRRLELDADMSGIDFSRLSDLSMTGSSDVSGNTRLMVDWGEKAFASELNLTRIGRQTLEALLLAVDQKEANPGVLKLRRFLADYKVAPRRVEMVIRYGLASMRSEFNMGLRAKAAAGFIDGFAGDTFSLAHLPVSGFLSKYLDF